MNNMNQNGRSMIEMLGVLAIIGVLSVGGIAGYSKAMLKYKTNKTIDEITMLTTNIRTLYAQQKTFNGLDGITYTINSTAGTKTGSGTNDNGKTAIEMGVVPNEMDKSTSSGGTTTYSLKHPFNGAVTITVDDSVVGSAGLARAFIIGVNNIPKEACMAIATSDWGSNYSSGLIGMGVLPSGTASTNLAKVYAGCTGDNASTAAGSVKSAALGTICASHMPLQVAAASTQCNCTGSACSVAFKYY